MYVVALNKQHILLSFITPHTQHIVTYTRH